MESLPAKREMMLSKIGHSDDRMIVQANAGVKVMHLGQNMTPLAEALRYVFVLIGLRREALPTEAESMVLRQFICANYGNITIDEIRTAFDLAVKGELDVDIKHFQNFSTLYFSQVMKAYQLRKGKAMMEFQRIQEKERMKEQVSTIDPDKAMKEFHENMLVDPYRRFFESNENEFDVPIHSADVLYNHMKNIGLIDLTQEEMDKIKAEVTEKVNEQEEMKKEFKTLSEHMKERTGQKEDITKKWMRLCRYKAIEIAFLRMKMSGKKPAEI